MIYAVAKTQCGSAGDLEEAIRKGEITVIENDKGLKLYYFPNEVQGNRESVVKDIRISRSKATTKKALDNIGSELLASLGWEFDTKAIEVGFPEL